MEMCQCCRLDTMLRWSPHFGEFSGSIQVLEDFSIYDRLPHASATYLVLDILRHQHFAGAQGLPASSYFTRHVHKDFPRLQSCFLLRISVPKPHMYNSGMQTHESEHSKERLTGKRRKARWKDLFGACRSRLRNLKSLTNTSAPGKPPPQFLAMEASEQLPLTKLVIPRRLI